MGNVKCSSVVALSSIMPKYLTDLTTFREGWRLGVRFLNKRPLVVDNISAPIRVFLMESQKVSTQYILSQFWALSFFDAPIALAPPAIGRILAGW